jgi:voltage-gated sodium channel type IV alpha
MNSVCLASYDYNDQTSLSLRNKSLDIIGTILTILFTIEGLCKILAHGFILHKRAYLRNGWNWLDFIVIIAGWVVLIPGVPQFKGLRTLRILRPLRLINQFDSLKKQVESLIKALT